MKKYILMLLAFSTILASCDRKPNGGNSSNPEEELSEEYYTGGKTGTVFNRASNAFEQVAPAVTDYMAFKRGEKLFEQSFVTGDGPAGGLGPVYIRTSCETCHPGYGRSRRVDKFDSNEYGNGYLVMIHNPDGSICQSFTTMLQTRAVEPYLPPVDESGIRINWIEHTDEYGNKYADGETYSLIYPEVTIDRSAILLDVPSDYQVSIEGTIGIFGTGLLDAIPEDSIIERHLHEQSRGYCQGVSTLPYALDENGEAKVGRYTYGCTRSTLQNGPGSNALWNITNVTRPDRNYLYATTAWIEKMAEMGLDTLGFAGGFEKTEMTMEEFDDFMIWHRGLAVPAARDLDNPIVQQGKELFYSIGCTACHKPSWTTGYDKHMPGFSYQKIWPYTDLLRHDLGMKNPGLRQKCRTTPLWGKGLMYQCTGANDMLHDMRARTFEEAILWHGGEAQQCKESFRNLSKSERDALVKFLEAI
ncbi:MAG: hypothetical protein LBH92_07080 [Bacteroidales bacterium]|jgi:CxxC motif-containing protein (DUF1111 family)|nr:hypothetical protein [Bacteroidales bacterium]